MSTWVCDDFDQPFNQTFQISRITSFDSLRIKVLKAGTINAGATFTFKINDNGNTIFDQTITADFINTNLTDNGDRADLVFSIDSFVLLNDIDDTAHDYVLNFTSSGYVSSANSRFLICRRQEDDTAVPIIGTLASTPEARAVEQPIFFEIFRWSKDSLE